MNKRKDPPNFEQNDLNQDEKKKVRFTNFVPRLFIPGVQPEIDLFSTITVYGKRRTGKSVFIKWMMQAYKEYFPWLWVFTKTKQNNFYRTFVPDKFVIREFDADVLQRIMDRQVIGIKEYLENGTTNPRAVIVWDDYSGNDIRFNNKLSEYYWTGRHYSTLNFFCAQHVTLTPPSIRSNSDLVVIFNSDYANSLEEYWRDFAGKTDKDSFICMMDEFCGQEKHGFLAIVNDPNCPPEEKYYFGKADILPIGFETIVGCMEYWKGSEKQLSEIQDGTLKRKIDLIHELSQPNSKRRKTTK